MIEKLLRLLPAPVTALLAKRALPLAIVAAVLVLVAGIAAAALVAPGAVGITAARISDTVDLPSTLGGAAFAERDADQDGLSDALENYLYGTDPNEWNSSGTGIPDGWLAQYGFDPLSPLVRSARGAAPPADALPAAYDRGYPLDFTPTLLQYYAYGAPADYAPGDDAPWWRADGASVADPSEWDQSGTGIPTGWLLRYGLDPRRVEPDRVVEGAAGNLTLREAFEHNTDPRAADSDADGLTDWAEIYAHGTDPARFSTSGSGIADGWLLRFGLDAFDADVGSRDTDLDGLTNLEEFVLSHDAFGMPGVLTQGLSPLDWQTARTGIPDGWFVRYGLSPFGGDTERVVGKASDWPEYRTYVPEGKAVLPDLVMTIRESYAYGRPSDWSEARDGVWWGGTNPVTLDSDDDGMPDPIEIRGWYANVTTDTGPEARARSYLATSNPLEADSDGDGLLDLEEYRGRAACDGDSRTFPPTDPRNRDTAFSGLTDLEKVCGVVRGEARYDLHDDSGAGPQLDPTRADSAGDLMRDGARLDHWHAQWVAYKANPKYAYAGSAYRTLYEFTDTYGRFAGLTKEDVLAQFRPDGDVDADGLPNVLDADPSGGLHLEKWPEQGAPRSKVLFLAGPEMDVELYRLTEFDSPVPHVESDPANPDTDGDGLPDAWEVRFGRFDPAIPPGGGWDLDPSKADSDGDGVPDADGNNDGDVVTWYAFDRRGSGVQRTSSTFDFSNLLEFQSGTNPNEASTAGDGVPDGWKAFWGSRVTDSTFPNLLSARDPRLGSVVLDQADRIESAIGTSPIQPLANLQGVGRESTGYIRVMDALNITGTDTRAPAYLVNLRADERFVDAEAIVIRTLDGRDAKLARIEGVFTLTYKREHELRTNPYLDDTDGDGAPDAYEAYYGVRGATGSLYPDPALAEVDPTKDPDVDGLTVTGECNSQDNGATCGTFSQAFTREGVPYGRGADPNARDSDGDGIEDGIEVVRGFDPLDPADIRDFANANKDDDFDGVPDYQELVGTGKDDFGALVRTDPKSPDSDGDGLLDGRIRKLDPRVAADVPVIAWFNSLGIAHRPATDGTVNYLGEVELAGSLREAGIQIRPDNAFSIDPKVPDGWYMYYLDVQSDVKTADTTAYNAFKPDWWVEGAHGVWWWGRSPAEPTDTDLDNDGLHDASGEDAFPATTLADRIAFESITVTNPLHVESFVSGGANASLVRERAQRMGDGAGDPRTARAAAASVTTANGVTGVNDRAQVAITLELPDGVVVTKGRGFTAKGKVVLDERQGGQPGAPLLESSGGAAIGVPNRTVLVSFFGPDARTVVGVGVTDAEGRFNITANVTDALIVSVPPAVRPFGHLNGSALQGLQPATVSAGTTTTGEPNRLVAWVLNSSWNASPTDPTYGSWKAWLPKSGAGSAKTTHATAFAVSAAIDVTVRSDTRLTSTVGTVVENGQRLVGDVRLQDASGAPIVSTPVRIRWDGGGAPIELLNLSTDRDGLVNVTNLGLLASLAEPGQRSLVATFESSDPYLTGTASTFPIAVRQPTRIQAAPETQSVTVGQTILVRGSLTTRNVPLASGGSTGEVPLAGLVVRATLGTVTESARTDDAGEWSLRIAVPGTLAPGPTRLLLTFDGSATQAPSETPVLMSVKRTSAIVGLTPVPIEGPREIDVTLRGRLVDNEGQGFAGPVAIEAQGVRVGTGTADEFGRFAVPVQLGRLPLGTQQLRVSFPGDAGHAAGENLTQARVTSLTTLRIDGPPATIVRGEPFTLRATLLDDFRQPVPQQAIAIHWRGERIETLVTNERGEVVATVQTSKDERPAVAQAAAEYVPGPTSVYQPSSRAAEVRVLQGVVLELEGDDVRRGVVAFAGRLLDDEGRPLAAAGVQILLDGVSTGEARTARNGTFEAVRVLSQKQPLGPMAVKARYLGTSTLSGAEREVTWHVRTPLTATFRAMGPFVRGEAAPLEGRVVDDHGAPVDAAIRVLLGETELGTIRATGGVVKTSVLVPADFPRGDALLTLRAGETPQHEAFEASHAVVVKVRPKVEVEMPALAIRGFSFGGEVALDDDKGQPLRNTTFVYRLGKLGTPVTGETDAEGRATLAAVAPLQGDAFFTLTVRGGADVVPAEYKTSTLRIVGPATPIGYASLILAVLIALAVVAIVVVAILVRRRQLQEVRDILDEAIRELLAGNEYASTIFLAYRRLGAHLARHGFAEKAHETPREFALGVRKAVPVGVAPLKSLIQLFEEARYSDHAIGSRERDDAVRNLTAVRGELDRILGQKASEALS